MRILLLLLSLLLSKSIFACSCVNDPPKISDYLESCAQVFVATLVEAKYYNTKKFFPYVQGILSKPKVQFKGNADKTKGLITGMNGTSCEGSLHVGKEYIVCANSEEYVSVAQCDLTVPRIWGKGRLVYDLFNKKLNKAQKTDADKKGAL